MKTSSKALSVFLTAFRLSMLALASLTAQAATPAAPTLSVGNQTNGLRARRNAVAGNRCHGGQSAFLNVLLRGKFINGGSDN